MSAFWETYVSTGMRQDVSDVIEVLSPDDTPAYAMLRKGKATAVAHEWLDIALPSASAVGANSFAEGVAFVYASGSNYQPNETRRINYCQIFHKTWKISGTVEVVGKYGRESEYAMRKMHALRAFKVDVEVALLDNSASGAGGSGSGSSIVRSQPHGAASYAADLSDAPSRPINASAML